MVNASVFYGDTAVHLYYLVLATYVSMRAVQVLTTTPALASTHENKGVKASRTHWFALHGLVLSARWGYGFLYVLATSLKSIRVGSQAGASLQGYIGGLNYFQLLSKPLELYVHENMRNALVTMSVLSLVADHFLANAFWKALFSSSAVPEDKRNSPLFSKKPFADIITRTVASVLDLALISILYFVLNKFTEIDDIFRAFVPPECQYDFTVFVLYSTIAYSLLRIVTMGQGIGRKLSGAILVSCDGSDLSFIDVLMREAVYFCCSAAVLEPLIICFNEEQGNSVDLITCMRDVDSLASTPYAPKEVSSGVETTTSSVPLNISRQKPIKSTPDSKADTTKTKTPKTNKKKQPANDEFSSQAPKTPIQGVVTLSEDAVTPATKKQKAKSASTPVTDKKSTKVTTSTKKRTRADEEEQEEPAPKSTRKTTQKTPKRTQVEEAPPTTTRKSTRKK